MTDIESKLKWAVKTFLLTDSIKGVFEVNDLVTDIMNYAKYGTAFNSGEIITDIAYKVTVAYFRHKWTNYDELLRKGGKSSDYRELANKQARRQINRWKGKKKPLSVKDIRF
jgi:hypothetical protein